MSNHANTPNLAHLGAWSAGVLMASRPRSRSFAYLITAHLVSAIHAACFLAWAMHGFLQYEGLTPRQEKVEAIVVPILMVTQFPSWLVGALGGDTPSIVTSLLIGYLFGLALVHFASKQVIQLKINSFIWWGILVVVASDVMCFIALTNNPRNYQAFLRILLALVPVTLIAIIGLWIRRRQISRRSA